jgi:hypothetical protein
VLRAALRAGLSLRRRLAGALTGLVALPLLTLGLTRLDVLNLSSQTLLYLLVVVVVALVGGLLPALPSLPTWAEALAPRELAT